MNCIEWRPVIYNGETFERFEISSSAKLRNTKTKKVYKTTQSKAGYETVCVSLGARKKKKCFKVHRLVAEVFIANPLKKPCVNHKDGNKLNNAPENLEWVTHSENMNHAVKNDLAILPVPNRKLSDSDVIFIRENYSKCDRNYGSRALGKKFGLCHTQILSIVKGVTYKNV